MLTHERLKELLHYDPVSGLFTWLRPTSNRVKAGDIAKPNGRGYVTIRLDGKTYFAQRLAWLYVTGAWPTWEVDHWDGIHGNNRWTNLRDVAHAVNTQNIREPHRDNKTGFQGVVRRPSGKFAANVYIEGKQTSFGLYETPEEAHAVYVSAKRATHEGCTI